MHVRVPDKPCQCYYLVIASYIHPASLPFALVCNNSYRTMRLHIGCDQNVLSAHASTLIKPAGHIRITIQVSALSRSVVLTPFQLWNG